MQRFPTFIFLIFASWLPLVSSLSSVLSQSANTQCSCIPIPGSTECLPFDSKYQAATLDDAINTFTDLTLDDGDVGRADQKIQDPNCLTEECQACQTKLKQKLAKVGLLPTTFDAALLANATQNCTQYSFEDDDSSDDSSDDDDSSSDEEERHKKEEKEKKHHHRRRRQANPGVPTINASVVGTRYVLSCDRKGIATDGSGLMTLCTRCWIWRELPVNYYPRYLNELICDDTDNSCLSGYASCSVAHRSAYVVRNDTGIPQVVTLQAGSFCECRVQTGSALATLVTGSLNGTNSTIDTGNSALNAPSPAAPPRSWY